MKLQDAVKTAIATLALIYLGNQWTPTRRLIQSALNG